MLLSETAITIITIIVLIVCAGALAFPIAESIKFYRIYPRDLKQGAKTFGAYCAFAAVVVLGMIVIWLIHRG